MPGMLVGRRLGQSNRCAKEQGDYGARKCRVFDGRSHSVFTSSPKSKAWACCGSVWQRTVREVKAPHACALRNAKG